MSITCPKCNFTSAATTSSGTCPNCGVVYAKYLAREQQKALENKPLMAEKDISTKSKGTDNPVVGTNKHSIKEKSFGWALFWNWMLPCGGFVYLKRYFAALIELISFWLAYYGTPYPMAGFYFIIKLLITIDLYRYTSRLKNSLYRKCPQCAETIRREALICRYCQSRLE